MKQLARVLIAVAALSSMAGCASTEITSVWRDPDYQGPLKKVLVVAILKSPVNRRVMEDEFVARLKDRGVAAEAGYAAMPGDKLPDKDVVAATVSAKGFDSLFLVKLMGEKTERNYVAGSMAYSTGPHYGGWSGYYGAGYTAAYSPGYVVEDKFALAEASLYNAATEKIIWTAGSETWIQSQDSSLIRGYVSQIMKSLRQERIIP